MISFNTLRPRQNGRHFPDDIFKWIFANENAWISINISLKFVPRGPINNMPALVLIMAWRRPGDKPLFEPMLVSLLTQICVTRPQWVNSCPPGQNGRHFPGRHFKCISMNEKVCILIRISLKIVPRGPINNIAALVEIMDRRRSPKYNLQILTYLTDCQKQLSVDCVKSPQIMFC